jgi:murein DD-endopeptidase MepM/ murein hydrolase activator NlpD
MQMTDQKQPQREESPELVAQRLSAATRRRRARRRFSIAFVLVVASASWLISDFLTPEMSNATLSARPAPAAPEITPSLRQLPPMHRRAKTDALKSGDSLAALLSRNNVSAVESDAALDSLRGQFDSRSLRPGQKVRIFHEWMPAQNPETDAGTFAGLDFIPEPRQQVSIRRIGDNQFETRRIDRPLSERYFVADTLISSSVYEAARSSGVAPNLVVELIRLFSFSVDFQRDIRQGDQLEVLYTRRFDGNNQLAEEGEIVFAALTNRGERHAYWLHRHADGTSHYYDENGKSVQRLLMRTPVDGARLSSRFGMRRHPILGYTRMHRGLDFAAPTGTPIFAAGDGRVIRKTTKGNNGLFIKLQHKNNYQTAYAHMSRFAKGLKNGTKVKQGQIIGYVGRTGLATGPHLHYEVLKNQKPVNPRALDLPAARKMDATELAALVETRRQATKRIGNLAASQNALSSLPRRSGIPAR